MHKTNFAVTTMRLLWVIAATAMLLTSSRAAADSLSLSSSGTTLHTTVTEGASFDAVLSFQLDATSSTGTYTLGASVLNGLAFSSGDQTDKPTATRSEFNCPTSFTGPLNETCTLTFHFTTTLPAGDDSDSGIWHFTYPEFQLKLNGNVVGDTGVSPVDVITVNDPPPSSPVPEPSTVALLGTGALGLFGPIRRKLLPHRR